MDGVAINCLLLILIDFFYLSEKIFRIFSDAKVDSHYLAAVCNDKSARHSWFSKFLPDGGLRVRVEREGT